MIKTYHALKIMAITVSVFLMGYFLESFSGISSIVGDYFAISTELLPLVLSFSIFVITWYSYRRSSDNHSLFLGAAFFIIGLFDLFHLLSYPFMPDFITPNSPQKATLFWSQARLVSALLFLAGAYIYKDSFQALVNRPVLFASAIVLSFLSLITILFYLDSPTVSHSHGEALSTAAAFSLLVTVLATLYASYLYSERLKQTSQKDIICLIYGFTVLIFSYPVYFFFEYPEHLLRAAGFYFIYLAMYKSSIDQPYKTLALTGEKLRRNTEEKYGNLFNNAHDAIITTDLDDIITSWNRSAEKMFGWTANEVIGKKLSLLIIPPAQWDGRKQVICNAVSGMEIMGFDAVNLHKDGREIDVNVTISPLRDADKKIIALSSIVRDVTERKKIETALRYRLDFEKLIMSISTNFINISPDDIDRGINSALRAIGEFAGIDRSYVFLLSEDGNTIDNAHEWYADKNESQLTKLKGIPFGAFPWFTEKMRRFETICIPRIADLPPEASVEKGIFQTTHVKSLVEVPMINGDSLIGFLGLLSVKKEVTWSKDMVALLKIAGEIFVNALMRKRAAEAISQSEQKYRMLVENIQDGVFIIQDGKIRYVNEAFARTAGYAVEEIVGRDFREFLAPDDMERVVDNYYGRLEGRNVPKEYEIRIPRKDGAELIGNINVGLITYCGRVASMGTIKDITERKRAEEELSWEVEVNAAIAELSSTLLSTATVDDISSLVLEHAKRLTASAYGYAGYIDPETGYLVLTTMTRGMCDTCQVKDKNNILKDFRGLFGWVLTNSKPILTNEPANDPRSSGTPPGHIPIHRFLSAPALLKRDLVGQLSVASPVGNKIHIVRYYDRGNLVGQLALANSDRDYTERDLALVERLADLYAIAIYRNWTEEQIKESLKEKDVLLREIHHRVKNNMQIISSLLRLQSRYVKEKKYTEMFTESQNRITSMSLIHEKLYQSRDLARIDFNDYVRDLVTSLFQSYGVSGTIGLKMEVNDVFLGIGSAIPCGLIINELVTNSLKHAFPEGRRGEIWLSLRSSDEDIVELTVSDNGIGIPEDIDIRKTGSLGLHLVSIMVENQLHGEIDLNRNKGTEFQIKFRDVK